MSHPAEPSATLHGDEPAASLSPGFADRKELAAIAFERTRMPMVITDARRTDKPIVLANHAFLELTGYSAAEVSGRNCRFLQGEATSRVALAEVRAAITEEREVSVELLNYRKNGSTFWNRLHLSPVHDDDGQLLYYFGSQIDVTALRHVQTLEASERRLLLEVDHRARNVLAVVTGIVRLTRANDLAGYVAAVQERVAALSRAHNLLAELRWRPAPLGDLIEAQVRAYAGRRVGLSGPSLDVPAVLVQPLALVIHELVTNAAVFGALSVEGGKVSALWTLSASDGLQLRWVETGGPPPVSKIEAGFGLTMIRAFVERQLRGSVRFDWLSDGLAVTFSIPGLNAAAAAFEQRPDLTASA